MTALTLNSYEYKIIHQKKARVDGPASSYPCNLCDEPAKDWATLRYASGRDLDDYVALCRPCHRRYDGSNAGLKNGRHKLTLADVREIRRAASAGETSASIAKRLGVSKATPRRVVRGISWAGVV